MIRYWGVCGCMDRGLARAGISGAVVRMGEMRQNTAMQKKPMEERKGMVQISCAICGNLSWKPRAWVRRVANPTCSRTCAGKMRAKELVKQSHKGRAAWSPETVERWRKSMLGSKNPAWKGGSYIEPEKGYRMIRMPEHPRARTNGYVLEHILVAETMLGRALLPDEEVHHIDHNRTNNKPENLKIYDSHREHWVTEHLADVHAARDAAALKASKTTTRR